MSKYEDFKAQMLGSGVDLDGCWGFQCWDLAMAYSQWLGYPVFHCGMTGYAQDIWTQRMTSGILGCYDEVEILQPGDIVVFREVPGITPLSHIAIFDHDIDGANGAFLGQNQGAANGITNIIALPYSATFPTAFRPKCFVEEPDPAPAPANLKESIQEGEKGSVYRLYNLYSGQHFYTQSVSEANQLYGIIVDEKGQPKTAGWAYEGIAWIAPENGDPVYRLYEPSTGQHVYTPDPAEKKSLAASGWNDEGIAWYSGGSHPIYRIYNPKTGEHLLTADREEHDALCGSGWICEGQNMKW